MMSDEEFRNNFRVSRSTLSSMVDILGGRDTAGSGVGPLATASRERQLLLTLYYLGSIASFRKISEQFNMTMSSAFEFIDEVVELLAKMKDIFIRLPVGGQMISTMDTFQEVCGVKGVLGVLSDCHIPIRKPMHDPDSFSNWRGYVSVHLMTVSDANDYLTDVCVGWPGGMHEAEVLDSGPLAAQLANDSVRDTYMPEDCFLVGSETMPLRPWLMTPYRVSRLPPNDARKHNYNSKIVQTGEVGRRAVGVMKARFPPAQLRRHQDGEEGGDAGLRLVRAAQHVPLAGGPLGRGVGGGGGPRRAATRGAGTGRQPGARRRSPQEKPTRRRALESSRSLSAAVRCVYSFNHHPYCAYEVKAICWLP